MNKKVFVQASESLNGVLRFQSVDPEFQATKGELLDQYDSLVRPDSLLQLEELIGKSGLTFEFVGDAKERYDFLRRVVTSKFKCRSPWFSDHELHPFQHVGLNLVTSEKVPTTLLQWDTGTGKTLAGCLAAQKLVDDGFVDMVLLFCKKGKKLDWMRFFQQATHLDVKLIDSEERAVRHKQYAEEVAQQVYILNYEKARAPGKTKDKKDDWSRTDLWQLMELISGQNVLFIFDEAQKLGNATSLSSRGMSRLTKVNKSGKLTPKSVRMIALTATPYMTAPYNIRDIFNVLSPGLAWVSGPKYEFDKEYVKTHWYDRNYGYETGVKEWNDLNLPRLGKRIESLSHIAMKSDPEVSKYFPEMIERAVPLELSREDRKVYKWIQDWGRAHYDPSNPFAVDATFQALRMVCNTTESLLHSESQVAKDLVESRKFDLRTETSSKYDTLTSMVETWLEANEKVVLFTYWTNGTLFLYYKLLQQHFKDAPIFPYWGRQSLNDRDASVQNFNATRDGALFIASDAAQEGLNLYAPYMLHIETPYTHFAYKQRRDRIHRSDSKAQGIEHIWVYRFVTKGTVEEGVEELVQSRKNQAELIRGTPDVLSREETLDKETLFSLIYGETPAITAA